MFPQKIKNDLFSMIKFSNENKQRFFIVFLLIE